MTENSSSSRRQLLTGCGGLATAVVICAVCAACGYLFLPVEWGELQLGETTVAQLLGQAEPVDFLTPTTLPSPTPATPDAAATPQPTRMPTVSGSPTLPPTDTPIPRPTATPTATPSLPLEAAVVDGPEIEAEATISEPDLAATQVAEAIVNVLSGPQAIEGSLALVAIENGHVYPPTVSEVEFTWEWSGAAGCIPPPDGYGFEVRIWPNRPDFGPLGVDDAVALQDKIFCDPQTGRRSFKLGFLPNVPAVLLQGAGSFVWDVALIQLEPHTPIYASPPRIFEISLVYPEPGRFDPDGAVGDVKCSSFMSWAEAQAFFIAAGPQDPHKLDPDRDGVACNDIAPCLLTQPVESCKTRY